MTTPQPTHENVIPAAVRAQAERAEALMKQATAAPEAPAPEAPVAPSTDPQAPVAPTPETSFEAPPAQPAPAPAPDAPVTPPGNDPSWEQKFKSEQGRTKALREELTKMRGEMAALQAQLETYQKGAPELNFSGQRLVTPEEEKEYGQEFMDLVGRRAQEIAAPLMKELTDLKAQLNGSKAVSQENAKREFFDTLTKRVSNWREINRNEEFLGWLQEKDAFSGQIRQDLLNSAYNSFEADRVARFFESFLQEAAAVAPHSAAQPDAKKLPLEQLAAPGRAKSATVPNAGQVADKPIIKASDITAFYVDVQKGKYRGRDEDKSKIEAMIWDAQREGRIAQNQ